MHRQRRTKEQWNALFTSQLTSGFTPREYCAKHNIHLKTFSARKSDIDQRTAKPTVKLVKVVRPKSTPVSAPPPLTVVYRDVTVNVDHAVDAKWIVDVMKALAL